MGNSSFYKSKMQFGSVGMVQAAAAGLCLGGTKAGSAAREAETCGCAACPGNVTLSPALAGEIRLQLQMVALQADDLLQKRQQIVGGGHGSAIKLGGLGRILAGDGPEYGKVLHFDVPC